MDYSHPFDKLRLMSGFLQIILLERLIWIEQKAEQGSNRMARRVFQDQVI